MIDIRNLSKKRGKRYIFEQVNLTVEENTIVALLGASGSGKTSFLRMIAGLSRPCSGEIRLSGTMVSSPFNMISPNRRNVSMVFQNLALWPHLTVIKHLEFVSRKFRLQNRKKVRIYLETLLEGMRLGKYLHKYPGELSGGEQQRLAIARALASFPKYLLMDEPFSHLDDILRQELMALTLAIKKERGITIVYVTHHIDEALTVADKIVLMKQGSLHELSDRLPWTKEDVIKQMRDIP